MPDLGVASAERRVILATRSTGKLRELGPLFAAAGWRAVSVEEAGLAEDRAEDALESADSFAENALAKARWFAARLAGHIVVADDSGLEVEALGGAPGVRSKRWSGRTDVSGAALDEVNNALLQTRLLEAGASTPAQRSGRYVCAAAAVWAGGEAVALGSCPGRILLEPAGAGGFGYDPWFWSDELGRAFGEASVEDKQSVSHRGRAFRALLARLDAAFPR